MEPAHHENQKKEDSLARDNNKPVLNMRKREESSDEAGTAISKMAKNVWSSANRGFEKAKPALVNVGKKADAGIRRYPYQAILIGLGLGSVITMLFRRSGRDLRKAMV